MPCSSSHAVIRSFASEVVRPFISGELMATPGSTLLHRLFHEEAPELLGGRALSFACSCSRGRVEAMLVSLGRNEVEAALIGGTATVRCEF